MIKVIVMLRKVLCGILWMGLVSVLPGGLHATGFEQNDFHIKVRKILSPIVINGVLDEAEWETAESLHHFWQHWPVDTAWAEQQTRVKIVTDDEYLYFGAVLQDDSRQHIIQSLKHDSEHEHWTSDAFNIVLDPINKGKNGFLFGVNAGGAQLEGLLAANGTETDLDVNWDYQWFAEVKNHGDFWVVEVAIPFKALQYNSNKVWGINIVRANIKQNIYSTWTRFPMNFQGISLAHTGQMTLESLPQKSNGKVVVLPSVLAGINHESDGDIGHLEANLGLDTKVSLSSSISMDFTINPDFSQVDVDQQVTNLSRFSLFFPEKRRFFLENSDLFSKLGSPISRPIFTRRIGLEEGEALPIYFGAKVSGNLTPDMRFGLMNVQTGKGPETAANNYSVATFQQKVGQRSSVRAFLVNRQATQNIELLKADYNRVMGGEMDWVSANGNWRSRTQYHKSFSPGLDDKDAYISTGLAHNSKRIESQFWFHQVGQNYITDVGFTPRLYNYDAENDTSIRLGFRQLFSEFNYKIFPHSPRLNFYRPGIKSTVVFNDDGSLNEANLEFDFFINFADFSWLYMRYGINRVNLPVPTDIIGSDEPLPVAEYDFSSFKMAYRIKPQNQLSGRVFSEYGSFYNGTKFTAGTELKYRLQPWGRFGLTYNFNTVNLADPFGKKDLHLIGGRAELFFSRKMAWTTFLQYNTQAEYFTINARFQWRYKPMSDLFLVFTNNYSTLPLAREGIGLMLKWTYWLSL